VPGLRDAVRHGILVKPEDVKILAEAINLLLIEDKLRDTLAENAYNYSRNFEWTRTVEYMLRVLKG